MKTNLGEHKGTVNSQSSIHIGTFDERNRRKFKKDFSSCKHLDHTQSSRVSNIGKISNRSNRLSEFQMIVESSHCPRFRKMRMNGSETQRYQSVLARAGQSSLRVGESSIITPDRGSIGNMTPYKKSAGVLLRNKKEKQFLDLHEIVKEKPSDQEQTFWVDTSREHIINT